MSGKATSCSNGEINLPSHQANTDGKSRDGLILAQLLLVGEANCKNIYAFGTKYFPETS